MLPTLSVSQALLAILSGFLVGFSLGLIGGGGSILAVPLLLYVVGYSEYPHLVIGTTALAVGLNALVNVYNHHRNNSAGALLGAQLGLITPGRDLLFYFGILMIIVGLLMLRKDEGKSVALHGARTGWIYLIPAAVAVGVASGYFGIGGGFLIVPALMLSSSLSIGEAIPTSLISVGAFGLISAFRYALAGQVDYIVSLLYLLGGFFGGVAGSKFEYSISKRRLRIIFSTIVILVAVYIIFQNIPSYIRQA